MTRSNRPQIHCSTLYSAATVLRELSLFPVVLFVATVGYTQISKSAVGTIATAAGTGVTVCSIGIIVTLAGSGPAGHAIRGLVSCLAIRLSDFAIRHDAKESVSTYCINRERLAHISLSTPCENQFFIKLQLGS